MRAVQDGPDPRTEMLSVVAGVREYLRLQRDFGLREVPRLEASSRTDESKASQLDRFHDTIRDCRRCRLCEARSRVVCGDGSPDADVMFVGEAPGREEDVQGIPFVGAAGDLLNRMIASIGLSREAVYIANVVKCRPPQNRDPEPDEVASCEAYLARQIEIVEPDVICTLGRFAAQCLLKTTESLGRLRGKVAAYEGIKLIPTYHPAALLRNPQWKRPAWDDLRRLRKEYDGVEV